ncbi:MAG: 1-acyl-sn-glycerol-3-phosphate acyltransferase [Proteobacteria bacterium]|nr:1-acyl-sn-glycerol-3-phosphate acyltransferase [Pseudomonadota bacterium]
MKHIREISRAAATLVTASFMKAKQAVSQIVTRAMTTPFLKSKQAISRTAVKLAALPWRRYGRALSRAAAGLVGIPVAVGLTALQGAVVGPLTGDYRTIPKMLHRFMRKLFGYKIEFNAASAPLVKDKRVWFVSNHTSLMDFIVAGSALNGTFVGKAEILKWPVIAQLVQAAKFIGVARKSEFNDESRGKIAQNFNAGFNVIMFPEGTTGEGKKVYRFHGALLSLLYGGKATDKKKHDVALKDKVIVQPVAIRVKSVNGKNAAGNDNLRQAYTMYDEHNALRMIWKCLQMREIVLELTAFTPLDPTNFSNANDLANKAALDIASVVNPGQTTFEKKAIPGM